MPKFKVRSEKSNFEALETPLFKPYVSRIFVW